jgi:hypothetical protein
LEIEKKKAERGKCRVLWLDTESTILRLLYAVLIAEAKRVTSFIIVATERAMDRASCGSAVSVRDA